MASNTKAKKTDAPEKKQDLASFFKLGTVAEKTYTRVYDPDQNDGYVVPKNFVASGTMTVKEGQRFNANKLQSAHQRIAELKQKKRQRDTSVEDAEEKQVRNERAKRAKTEDDDEESDFDAHEFEDAFSDIGVTSDMDLDELSDQEDEEEEQESKQEPEELEDRLMREDEEAREMTEEEKALEVKRKARRVARKEAKLRKREAKEAQKAEELAANGGQVKKKTKRQTAAERAEETERTVFVGNVPVNVKRSELIRLFSKYGEVESVRIRNITVTDPKHRLKAISKKQFHPERDSAIAYVVFDSDACVKPAMQANGTIIGGKHIRVDSAVKTEVTSKDYANCVYVSNLPLGTEEEDLFEIFSNCGKITSVRVIRDNEYKVSKGFAYVRFTSEEAFNAARELHLKVTYKDKILHINPAVPRGAAVKEAAPTRKPRHLSLAAKFKSKAKFQARKSKS